MISIQNAHQIFLKILPDIKDSSHLKFLSFHVPQVVKVVKLLGESANLDYQSMGLANCLHDLGYVQDFANHAEASIIRKL